MSVCLGVSFWYGTLASSHLQHQSHMILWELSAPLISVYTHTEQIAPAQAITEEHQFKPHSLALRLPGPLTYDFVIPVMTIWWLIGSFLFVWFIFLQDDCAANKRRMTNETCALKMTQIHENGRTVGGGPGSLVCTPFHDVHYPTDVLATLSQEYNLHSRHHPHFG